MYDINYSTITHGLKTTLNLVDTSGMHIQVRVPKCIEITTERDNSIIEIFYL